ncbi:MAG: hypothetical protein GY838_13435 [bacterium]|nr:hypothetical protein [bacterium]
MVANVYPSRAAERVVFREQFRNPADVVRNGGTLVGSPEVKDGVVLDGATQYVSFLESFAFGTTEHSIVLEFIPTVAHDSATMYLIDSGPSDRYRVYLAAGALYVGYSDTIIASISEPTISGLWVIGEVNRLVISTTSGDTDVFFSGTSVLSGGATAWDPVQSEALYLGATRSGTSHLTGTIKSFSTHARRLTQADVTAMEEGRLWSYMNRASVALDMAEATAKAGTVRGTVEALVDGDMEAVGTAAWTPSGDAVLSKDTVNPHGGLQSLRIVYGSASSPRATQTTLTAGKRYRARGWIRCDSGVTANVYVGGVSVFDTTSSGWVYFDVTGVALSISFYLRLTVGSVGTGANFDDVSVVETDELLDDSDMEATGVGDWTAGASATLTKESADPYEGSQCLRVAYNGVNNPFATGSITLVVGATYRVTGWIRSDGTSLPRIQNDSLVVFEGTTSVDWQAVDVTFVATHATRLWLRCLIAVAGYGEYDQIHVRPVLSRTLDKSANGHVCLLGDGVTAADKPSFLNPGFEFDGANQYMQIIQAAGVYGSAVGFTTAAAFRPDFFPGDGVNHYLYDSTSGARYYALKQSTGTLLIIAGNTTIASIAQATYEPHWRVDGRNVLVVSGVPGNTNAWLNSHQILTNDSSPWTPMSPTEVFIGSRFGGVTMFGGRYDGFYVWQEALSPLQADDLTIALGVNV